MGILAVPTFTVSTFTVPVRCLSVAAFTVPRRCLSVAAFTVPVRCLSLATFTVPVRCLGGSWSRVGTLAVLCVSSRVFVIVCALSLPCRGCEPYRNAQYQGQQQDLPHHRLQQTPPHSPAVDAGE